MYHFFEMFWSFEEHDFRDILLAKTDGCSTSLIGSLHGVSLARCIHRGVFG
jgi:hypothetical protein